MSPREATTLEVSAIPSQCEKLLSRGFAIFPLQPREKKPLTTHGVKDATRDRALILAWARQFPNCNWGIACGQASAVSVLDFDSPTHSQDLSVSTPCCRKRTR